MPNALTPAAAPRCAPWIVALFIVASITLGAAPAMADSSDKPHGGSEAGKEEPSSGDERDGGDRGGRGEDGGGNPPSGNATGVLGRIAQCESGGNPTAVSADGRYRGKYQFTRETWLAVGGQGDPAQASEAEQDRRAATLYAREGAKPWPSCGRAAGGPAGGPVS